MNNKLITQQDIKFLNKFRNSYYNYPEEELRNVAQVLDKLLPQLSQQEKKDELLELYRKTFTKNISNTNYEEWIILESQIKTLEGELK